jgi:hypothetical protein
MRPCAPGRLRSRREPPEAPQDRRHACRRPCSHEHQRPPQPSTEPLSGLHSRDAAGQPTTNDETHRHAVQRSAASRPVGYEPPASIEGRGGGSGVPHDDRPRQRPRPAASTLSRGVHRRRIPRPITSPRHGVPPRTPATAARPHAFKAGPPTRASNVGETATTPVKRWLVCRGSWPELHYDTSRCEASRQTGPTFEHKKTHGASAL